ncbi:MULTISPECIES: helix-turn-helix domain-containing protein [Paenibacillus]|uniref:Transcriptional regulator n=1 Tax=Paenibacillus polymyxa TaxID=1406 RepID=A0ABX2Z3S9_PAEPO|nr:MULTISPECIES: helix-turn-helix transcriptional regulator [Paenibacillus]ODA05868.1 transcriptional regulator [Paenibacillus polymyxa]OMF46602.1 transcriptional regulator [Paenibacillus peoriae]OMF72520.1 transcriptional regulator [Paenibacillus peoriae]QYK68318.1 helix-turn-helix protein [Paenibacillus sp. S02]
MYEKFLVLLEQYGKTPYQVSKDTGVSTATLTNWKQGRYKPKTDKLKILADYFGVTVDYFLS